MFRTYAALCLLMLSAIVGAEGVAPRDDEVRIEVLVRARAEALLLESTAIAVDPTIMPPPVATTNPEAAGIVAGPIQFEQLSKLQGRWISVRLSSGSMRRGELVSVKGNDLILKIGSGAQGAQIPLSRKKIRTLELLP